MIDPGTALPPITRSDWVDRELRNAILTGDLAPGERLVTSALAERFGVSPTPLREALQRLAADRFVELTPQRGARVAPLSLDEMHDIYELREILEPLALRRSLSAVDGLWRNEVCEAYDGLVTAIRADVGDRLELERLHWRFHRALLSRCDSSWLLHVVEVLAQHSVRYRQASIAPRGGSEEVIREHEHLLDACLAGDVEAAVAQLTRHLRLTVECVTAVADPGTGPNTEGRRS